MQHAMTPDMRKCVEACQRCHNLCLQAATGHAVEPAGGQVDPAHFRLLIDCAEICQASANFMLRGSHFHDHACQLCVIICDACARDCEQVGGLADCMHACQRCAESCRQIVESTVVRTS
jgi:hypothetical protein